MREDDKSEAIMNASEQHLRSQGIATNVALVRTDFFAYSIKQKRRREKQELSRDVKPHLTFLLLFFHFIQNPL